MSQNNSRPLSIYILLVFIIFQGLSGILGGMGLVLNPTGEALNIPVVWLEGSPFSDFLIPGIVLLVILGIFPLAVFFGLLKRIPSAWLGALITGLALIIWLVVEIMVIGYQSQPPLQLIYGIVGIVILILVGLPPVQKYYKNA